MSVVIYTKVGENRGQSRIWIEGQKLAREGITPKMKWAMKVGSKSLTVSLFQENNVIPADFQKSGKVSVRKLSKNNGNVIENPLIEFRGEEITSLFGKEQPVKVSISGQRIVITPQKTAEDAKERCQRLLFKIANNIPLDVGSPYHGGGILDLAVHHGFREGKISSAIRFAVELENSYLESSLRNNPELWSKDSLIAQGGIENINFFTKDFPKLDLVVAGIPCSGSSPAGRSKNKLAYAEEHPDVGALFYYTLNLIIASNPGLILFENVKQYASTSSMSVIRSVLESRGYFLQERVLRGAEFGAIEDRERLCVVAISHGLEELFVLDNVVSLKEKEQHLKCVMDDVPLDSPLYRDRTHLEEKETRDLANKKRFKRQIVGPDSETIGCIGKGYARARSTEPMIKHPEKEHYYRLLTVNEHAKVKTIPVSVVSGCSDTIAHEILGQSVIYSAFFAVARHLAESLVAYSNGMTELKMAS